MHQGSDDFTSFHMVALHLALELRIAAVSLSVQAFLRFKRRLQRSAAAVTVVADKRRSLADRQEASRIPFEVTKHDAEPGAIRVYKDSMAGPEAFFAPNELLFQYPVVE